MLKCGQIDGRASLHPFESREERNRLRKELEHDRVANILRVFDGLSLVGGYPCLDRWDAIGGKTLLGFNLAEKRPTRLTGRVNTFCRQDPVRPAFLEFGGSGRSFV